MAPGLVQVFDKYQQSNVLFFGVTPDSEAVVRRYVERYTIPWPVALVSRETIAELGASLGRTGPTLPTLLVIARGRIVWTDRAARWSHTHDADLPQQLSRAIDSIASEESESNQHTSPTARLRP